MADVLGGLGGLFGGLSRGMQLLIALKAAEEDRELKARGVATDEDTARLNREKFQAGEEAKPIEDIQGQLNKRNVTANAVDIRREYTPPAIGDTFSPATKFAPPEHLGATAPTAPGAVEAPLAPKTRHGLDTSQGDINKSHIAQVLERAKRYSKFDLKQSALDAALSAAEQKAQQTQLPESGGLPTGFEAQPDKTFTPYQMSGRPDPLDNIFGPLLNNPINADILKTTDPTTYRQFELWKARRIGRGGGGAPSQQQADYDRAAAALRAQGKDPEQVLGPRPN